MASSGNQVAKLKSLQGVKTWVLDEAQELTDPELFDTIDFSVRTLEAPNQIILASILRISIRGYTSASTRMCLKASMV